MKLSHLFALIPLRNKPQLLFQMIKRIKNERLTYSQINEEVNEIDVSSSDTNANSDIEHDFENARKKIDRVIEYFHKSSLTRHEKDHLLHLLDQYIGHILQFRNEV